MSSISFLVFKNSYYLNEVLKFSINFDFSVKFAYCNIMFLSCLFTKKLNTHFVRIISFLHYYSYSAFSYRSLLLLLFYTGIYQITPSRNVVITGQFFYRSLFIVQRTFHFVIFCLRNANHYLFVCFIYGNRKNEIQFSIPIVIL